MEPAATRCKSCSRRLCKQCWQRTVDAEPWCELCIADLETAARAGWPLAITLLGIGGVAIAFGWRWETRYGREATVAFWVSFAIIIAIIAGVLAFRKDQRSHGRTIAARLPDDEPAFDADARVGHPYRRRLVRAAKLLAPPVSGRSTTLIVALCLALPALALPAALGLPRWLEAEIVLASWWLVWASALSLLLFRGFRLSHDYVLRAPRSPLELGSGSSSGSGCGDIGSGCSDPGCGEGIVVVLLAAVAAVVTLAAAWLLVELVVPALFFLAYILVRGALARVANDDHGCEHIFFRAVGWGALWATVYVAPLALVVWAVHVLRN